MAGRSPKKSELRNLTGHRRTGRPRTATAAARIYAALRAELVSLQAEIARSYGVSRTPVREAILRLADEGLVEIFPQSGIFVSHIPLAALPEAIIVRRSLEETTTRMATERASTSQILGLHAILERQREADKAGEREAFHQADEAFHAAIAEIAGHPGIWKLILQVKVLPQRGRMTEVIAEHEAVMAAIEARDPASAGAAMARHLERLLADISATQHNNPEFFDAQSQPA
jgi:GntR family transcriptional regulator, rspAB operon transcriptional repressor